MNASDTTYMSEVTCEQIVSVFEVSKTGELLAISGRKYDTGNVSV